MNAANLLHIKSYFYKKRIWILAIFLSLAVATAIVNGKWFYIILVFLIPVVVYVSIEKPFIFPFGTYVFLIPFDSILSMAGNSRGATLTKLFGILTILTLFLKGLFENKLIKPDNLVIYWGLFVFYCILSVLWAIKPELTLALVQTGIGLFVLYLISSSYKITRSELNVLKWSIFLGGLSASLIIIYLFSMDNFGDRITLNLGNRFTDPNMLAFNLLIPFSICISFMLNQNNILKKCLLWVILIMFIYSIILTGSRGGLMGISIIAISYLIFVKVFNIKKRIVYLVLIISASIIIGINAPEFFIERIHEASTSGGSGRTDIWYVGWKSLEKFWFIGAGLNNFGFAFTEFVDCIPNFVGLYRAPHNIFIGHLVELGILGMSLMLIGLIKHYRILKSTPNKYDLDQFMLKASFLGVLTSSVFLDTVWVKSFWLQLMLILMYKNASKNPI